MKIVAGTLLILALALLCAQCSPARIAGGNGSETTNGSVVYSNGPPASHAVVRLIDNSTWLKNALGNYPTVIDSTAADDSGRFTLAIPSGRDFVLQADAAGQGVAEESDRFVTLASGTWGTVVLAPYAAIHGTVDGSSGTPAAVFLARTNCAAPVSANGSFAFPNVPQGDFSLIVKQIAAGAPVVSFTRTAFCGAGDTARIDSLSTDDRSVLIDDFEDRDNQTALGALVGGGWWEAYSDSFNLGTSRLISPVNGALQNFAPAIVADAAPRNNCLHVQYALGTQGPLDPHPYPYVYVGFPVGTGLYDFSGLDTLSFFAKGSGSVMVELIQQVPGVMIRAVAQTALTAAWTQVKFTPADLSVITDWFPSPASGLQDTLAHLGLPRYTAPPTQWSQMCVAINAIHFVCAGGTDCWLDDMRIHGIRLNDLVR